MNTSNSQMKNKTMKILRQNLSIKWSAKVRTLHPVYSKFLLKYLNWFHYIALAVHKIELLDEIVVDIFDNNGTHIKSEDLYGIVGQKFNCGCFYIELKISGEGNKTITLEVCFIFILRRKNNPQVLNKQIIMMWKFYFQQLRAFLITNKNAESIFLEHETTSALKKASRCKLVGFIAEMINEQYCAPTQNEIASICRATIKLFPCLKDETGGIVRIYFSFHSILFANFFMLICTWFYIILFAD